MSKRVLLAGIWHETNTFLEGILPERAFTVRAGDELRKAEGDASPLSGALEVAHERNWELVPIIDVRATPGATVADGCVELFWRAFRDAVRREADKGIDGVYLVLHGAMVSESLTDVEGEMLRRIRSLPETRDVPLCGVTDLHGNFTEAMARYSNGLIAYHENPHTDARESAVSAAYLLDRLMDSGERPITLRKHPPLMWPPTGTGTASEPMKLLEERAREIEKTHDEVLSVSVYGGFSFADIPETGVSFSITTLGDPAEARSLLDELGSMAMSLKESGNRIGMTLEEAIGRLTSHDDGPVLLVEPADNIGAGAPGDNTSVLRALVEHGISNAGVVINDPETVQRLWDASSGTHIRVEVGGKSSAIGSEPLPLEVEVLSRSDGRFTLEDRHSHLAAQFGERIDMGPCALVAHEGVRVLLTSQPTAPFDLGQWRSQGINPEELSVIGVKAAVGHRRAYDLITKASYTVDTPGPCAENLSRLPFRRVTRPIYPLEETV